MKKILLSFLLAFSLNAFSQVSEGTSATTSSPFVTATKLIESGLVTIISPFASTAASIQARGVAGKEQLRDELVALNDDMMAGRVSVIEDVKQATLRELMLEIAQDEVEMENIKSQINSDSELLQISTAILLALMV